MSLLISTVLSGSRNRLAPLPELPWTMPGIDAAMLGADDEHVAAVAIGDDLLLQILRGVLAAQVGLERAAQPRPLLAQPIPDAPQLRARIVHDLAAGIDLAADVGDLALERGRAFRRSRRSTRERAAARAGLPAAVASIEARKSASVEQVQRFERAALDRERLERSRRDPPARAARSRLSARNRTVSAVASSAVATARGIGQRLRAALSRAARRASARSGRPPRRCDRIREP